MKSGIKVHDRVPSPVTVEVVQLFLHVAAEAASVVSIQPLPHHTHAVLTLMFVKGKVFDLRGDATTQAWMGLVLHYSRCLGRRNVPPGVQGKVKTGKESKEETRIEKGHARV